MTRIMYWYLAGVIQGTGHERGSPQGMGGAASEVGWQGHIQTVYIERLAIYHNLFEVKVGREIVQLLSYDNNVFVLITRSGARFARSLFGCACISFVYLLHGRLLLVPLYSLSKLNNNGSKARYILELVQT